MPKRTISVRFPEGDASKYITDWGQPIIASATFNLPPDIDDAAKEIILTAIGGTDDAELPPCPAVNGTLRKLKFTRAKGNTMSVPVRTRQDLLSAATVITGVLNSGGSSDNPVVCIDLIGEDFPNLNDEMGLSYEPNSFAATHRAPPTAPRQYFWAGNIQYSADSTNPAGGVIFQPVKVMSNLANNAPTQLANRWNECAGDFIPVVPCPRPQGNRNPLKHRRFILTFIVGPANNISSEKTEVPVKDFAPGSIIACGTGLAALPGAYCIGYRGESYRLYHKLLSL